MNDSWTIIYTGWDPKQQPLRESLCTLGNGYFCTRGAAEEMTENGYNYPGTYLAGGYNRATTEIQGETVENEDLVNWPNWLFLSFRHNDGEWFNLDNCEVLDYTVELSIKEGVLKRKMRFKDKKNRETSLISRRVVSMHNPHTAGIEWTLIPENWSGEITVRTALDGNVTNNGVARYRDLEGKHLDGMATDMIDKESIYLVAITKQSRIQMAQAAKTRFFTDDKEIDPERESLNKEKYIGQDVILSCKNLQPVRIEKSVVLYTSRDLAISDPLTEAKNTLADLNDFNAWLNNHKQTWDSIWKRCDIIVESGDTNQRVIRLHLFHVFQTVSANSIDMDIGVPSRGWHGEAYRGHIFWDELYIFPFLNMHEPQLARSLLMYRFRRLPEARKAAAEAGYRGAMFPWQSGSNGREESQKIHLNPKSGRWLPDNSHLQRHINAAIPYNVWLYYQSTRDMEFMAFYGAEIILNTALFWSSITTFNTKRNRYEIRGVMGPDEYHTGYPGSEVPGLNNNAYTNIMAVWVMKRALDITDMFDDECIRELFTRINLEDKDLDKWKDITQKMFIPFHDRDIITQFEGFDQLEDLDWEHYHKEYGEAIRLDRILEKENDTPNRYKASKQADVLMLFYLFSSDELVDLLKNLGYDFKKESIPKNIEYYQNITSHGSTLSQLIHSWVYARMDRNRSWKSFEKALMSDFKDVQGGTTPEGIHLGAMAGTVDLIQRCYSGMEIRDDVLWLNPRLPADVKTICFDVKYRGHWITLTIEHDKLKIEFDKSWADPVTLSVQGEKIRFTKDDRRVFDLKKK